MEAATLTVLVFATGLGLLTAAVARRYNRFPLGWGLFGALVFVIALPLLLLLGHRPEDKTSVQLPRQPRSAQEAIRKSEVFHLLGYLGAASFEELKDDDALTDVSLEKDIDRLLAVDLIDVDQGRWVLSASGRALHPDPAPVPDPDEEVASSGDLSDQVSAPGENDVAARLRRLKELRQEGLVADDEYEDQRMRILGEL